MATSVEQAAFEFFGFVVDQGAFAVAAIATEVLQPCRHQSLLAFQMKLNKRQLKHQIAGKFWAPFEQSAFGFVRFDSSWMNLERFGSTPQ